MAVDWADAQAAVIGAALIDPRCVPEILAEMRPEDFQGVFLRFFEAIRALNADQTPVDIVTVLDKTGAAYTDTAKALMECTPTAANVRSYIRICKEQARMRLLQTIGTQLAGAATLEEAREIMGRAAEISMENGRQQTVSPQELGLMWIEKINAKEKPKSIGTGFGSLDSVIRARPGQFHIIAGKTSHGKSALALQIAWNMAQTHKVGYFSNEMPVGDFDDRLISMTSGEDHGRVQSIDLDNDGVQSTCRAAADIAKRGLHYEPASGMTVDDIRARTLQRGYEIIFVDYLQLVRYPSKGRVDNFTAVGEISKALAIMARTINILVFATSQLSRQNDGTDFEPVPPLSSLRESGQLEQDAETVTFVHAPLRQAMPRFRVLDVAKNRSGPIGRFFIDFAVSQQRFAAPSVEDYRLWKETMHKRRMLTAEERREIAAADKAEQDEIMRRRLENEQRKRHKAEREGGNQTELPL